MSEWSLVSAAAFGPPDLDENEKQDQCGETASGADIRMVRGGFVYGTLIDPATNQPIKLTAGQSLHVGHYGPARPRPGGAVTSTVVEADGSCRPRAAALAHDDWQQWIPRIRHVGA
jgi:hypothetical protein